MAMFIAATVVLLMGFIDDIRSRKVHNALVVGLGIVVFSVSFHFRGFEGLAIGGLALLTAFVLTTPLFALGVLGGGDVKLFAVFAFCIDPISAFWTLMYSVIWGALFGVTRAALQRNLLSLVRSTLKAASRQRIQVQELHKVPYTFSLLLGWLTQLTLLHAGGVI